MGFYQIDLLILLPVILAVVALLCSITIAFLHSQNSKANKYLVLFFLMIFFSYVIMSFQYTPLYNKLNWYYSFYFFNYSSSLMLFLYVQTSLIKNINVVKQYFLVFVPPIVFLLLILYFIDENYSNNYIDHYNNKYHFIFKIFYELSLYVINLLTILKYTKSVKQSQSSFDLFQYKWIKLIVISSIIFSLYPRFMAVLSNYTSISIENYISYFSAGIFAFIYFMIIYIKFLLNTKNTLAIEIETKINKNKVSEKPNKEQKALYNKILKEIEINKIFIDPDFSLTQLASILNLRSRAISRVINCCSNNNFYDLINSYRIKEAIKIMKKSTDTKLSIKEIMYQVGYNSKSSFNTAFKKQTGKTPSSFRKNHL